MSWSIFKQELEAKMSNSSFKSSDEFADFFTKKYDECMRRGLDVITSNTVIKANTELMKSTISYAMEVGRNSKTDVFYNQNVSLLGKGAVAYWTGAELGKVPPIVPAPGTILNIAVVSNIVTSPGVWPEGVIPVLPATSNNPYLDTFIFQAAIHLQTISGICNTISQYPPIAPAGPGVILWTGFNVPASAAKVDTLTAEQLNKPVETPQEVVEEKPFDAEEALRKYNESRVLQGTGITQEELELHSRMAEKDATETVQPETPVTPVTPVTPATPTKPGKFKHDKPYKPDNLNRGWKTESLNRQVEFVRTIVDPYEAGPKLKKLYGDNIAECMMAVMKNEQGFKGFNNNIGGFDITAGGWRYNEKYHDGYVVLPEGRTKLLKAFASFKSIDAFYEKTAEEFTRKGAGKITNVNQFADFYWNNWFGGDGAAKLAFDTYPNISKAKGGPHATLQDYINSMKSAFKRAYNDIQKYMK